MNELNPDTFVISAGRARGDGNSLNVPPVMASNFYKGGDAYYTRTDGTATSGALEDVVAGLEGGRALAFASGMAAAAVVLHRLPVGSVLAVPNDPYHGVKGLVEEGEAQGRWTVLRLDLADTTAWTNAALTADLLWLESPANPLITVADLPAICSAPRKPGTIVAVDSTFATPLIQRPLDYGADVAMHSATKFIGGHSDLLAGVIVVRDDDLYDEFHTRRMLTGATIGGLEAFLAVRGVRTLALRLERAQENAMVLAERLDAHPQVTVVRYPGLPSHETHAAAASFMNGYGAMMSFDLTGPGERATLFCEAAQIIHHATSLGGIETTMERRATVEGQETMPPTLIRLSVGCEHIDDLWTDLEQALEKTAV